MGLGAQNSMAELTPFRCPIPTEMDFPHTTGLAWHSRSAPPLQVALGPLRYPDGRPPGAGNSPFRWEMRKKWVWLLAISLSYPRQVLLNICVQY